MSFHNVRFPVDIAYDSKGGPRRDAFLSESDSGAEQVVNRWSQSLHEYDISYAERSQAQVSAVLSFFMARNGPLYAFRFKDFSDFTSSADHLSSPTPTDQRIGTGDGTTTEFQLTKLYGDVNYSFSRRITKPVSGTVRVAVNGTEIGAFDVNCELGIVHFEVAPLNTQAITAGFEFDVMVRFKDAELELVRDNFSDLSIHSIKLVECEETDLWPGIHTGGASYQELNASVTSKSLGSVSASAKLWSVLNTYNGARVYLPPKATTPVGLGQFIIENLSSSSYPIGVYDVDTTTLIVTLAASRAAVFSLSSVGGTLSWSSSGALVVI
jgi:uncharacterized protein (TIGR02217 family)